MKISLLYCHIDAIEIGTACFTTQIGSQMVDPYWAQLPRQTSHGLDRETVS